MLYTLASVSGGKQRVTQELLEDVSGILKILQSRINDDERGALAGQIYERLHKIGQVLAAAE